MQPNWLESLIYGLISGLSEFLPVSSEAHRALFLRLTGTVDEARLRLAVHIGAFLSLLIFCTPVLSRLRRERKIAAVPKKHRRRQPDIRSLLDIRVLRTAGIALLVAFLAYPIVGRLYERLWVLAIFLAINGMLLYVPQFLPGANKDSQSLSSLDAVLIGLAGGAGVIPGISRVGASVSVGLTRGADRRYALDTGLLLSIPALIVLALIDCGGLFAGAGGITAFSVARYFTAAVGSFAGSYCAVSILRFLAVRAGFSGFAYYCWGAALFSFVLYLTI